MNNLTHLNILRLKCPFLKYVISFITKKILYLIQKCYVFYFIIIIIVFILIYSLYT